MSEHRFERVAEALRLEIARGRIPVGELLPTERELQSTYDVSRTTIRSAIARLVEAGWAEVKPNRGVIAKAGPVAIGSKRIAFIDHVEAVHKSLFFALHRCLAVRGYELAHVDSTDLGTLGAIRHAASIGFAAAFVWPKGGLTPPGSLAEIQPLMPVICVDHGLSGEETEMVLSDHFGGARAAVGHLLDLGRRRIAISGNFTHLEDAQLRFAGYAGAYLERGLVPSACDYVFSSPQEDPYEDTRLLRFRLRQEDRPDAVFVLHDMSVPAVFETVLDVGLRVPEDVAIVGFGNDLPFSMGDVGLTTVAMNWDSFAQKMVDRLIIRLRAPTAPFARTVVPTRLVVRGSCGAPQECWSSDPYEASSVQATARLMPSMRGPRAKPIVP